MSTERFERATDRWHETYDAYRAASDELHAAARAAGMIPQETGPSGATGEDVATAYGLIRARLAGDEQGYNALIGEQPSPGVLSALTCLTAGHLVAIAEGDTAAAIAGVEALHEMWLHRRAGETDE